jgi:phenylacetic acid degradation operon negative regulatory protein
MVDEILSEAVPGATGATRPRAYLLTIYGLYAREGGGWFSVSNLIRMLGQLEVDEPAVRSSISRLKRRGILYAERLDGSAGYALSPQARTLLERGDRRIFTRPRATVEDGWILVVFSVPESERKMRHLIRSRLSGLGFGTVGPGVWVAPAHLKDETADVLRQDDLMQYVDLFEGGYLSANVKEEVATWWDLDSIDKRYRFFVESQGPVLEAWRRRRRKDDEGEAFADYVRALTAWRRLPFLDPGLPPELLPHDWSGGQAEGLFQALRDRLETPAHRFVDQVREPVAG